MDEESSGHPSELLLKLFQEAWEELRAESGESDPITTIQIETRDGENKEINGFEFWQQRIEEVERQNNDRDFLFYSSTDEEKIEELFTKTDEPQPGQETAFYRNEMHYIPRISNLFLQNLNLGSDQWFIAQDIPPNRKIIKIMSCKRYFSPLSTDNEIIIQLIYAMKLSEKMNKEWLANENKVAEVSEVSKQTEQLSCERESEASYFTDSDEVSDVPPTNTSCSEDVSEVPKQTEQLSCERESEASYSTDSDEASDVPPTNSSCLEDMSEVPKQTEQLSCERESEASYSIDSDEVSDVPPTNTSCLEDVSEVPKHTEQFSYERESEASYSTDSDEVTDVPPTNTSCLEDVTEVPKQSEQLSYERESEGSYSTDSDEVNHVPPANTTDAQEAPNLYQDTVWRDLSPNIATQNVNPQNLGINMNYPNILRFPQMPLMNRPNYGRDPFSIQSDSFRKPVYPYIHHFVRIPFSSRTQLPFIPPPIQRQPRYLSQYPIGHIRVRAPSPDHMPPRLLFPYVPHIPTPPLAHRPTYHQTILNSGFPPPAHQTQNTYYGDSTERNQQSVPYPSINSPNQWIPHSEPNIIHTPNNIPNYYPENFQLAHEQSSTQTAPDIPPDADNLYFINDAPAFSSISTTLDRVVQDVTNKSFCECIIIIKKKSGQKQLIVQAPLSLIIPIPDDDIEDDNQDDLQSGKCVLIKNTSVTAKPKECENDEMKNESEQFKNLNKKSNEDKSNNQPEAAFDEREYLQTPSIFEILNSRKDADPNEPQKVPTNYMEDVIQKKERRWKSMDQVRGSPSLDLILDMIRKDNEMLEEEERLQREKKAHQIDSSSAAAETEPQSSKEMTVSNPSDAGVILNTNPENVTVLEHSLQGTNIHLEEKLKIETNEEEMSLINNLTTSNERLSLGLVSPDSAVLNLKEKLCDNWSKKHKSIADVSKENLAAIISPDQTSFKKQEKSSSTSLEKNQTSSYEIHIKKRRKRRKRKTNVSVEDRGATSHLDQIPNIKSEKSSSLFPEKSQTSSNECCTKYKPINKMMRSSGESSSELVTDKNVTCQLQIMKEQETQTVDTDHKNNLDVAVNVKDVSTQTDKEIKKILSYAAVVRKNKKSK